MLATIYNITVFSICSAMIGGRFNTTTRVIPRIFPISFVAGAIAASVEFDILPFIVWLYAFAVIRLLPTGGLFQAINNDPPVYDGSRIEGIIYRITMKLWKLLPDSMTSWYVWGIIYGFVRTLPVIPAAIYLGVPALYFAPLIGMVYWLSGQMLGNTTKAVAVAEIVVGGMIGAAV